MNFLILYDSLHNDLFAADAFQIDTYRDFKIGKQPYLEWLHEQFPDWRQTQVLWTTQPLESFKALADFFSDQVRQNDLDLEGQLVFYDLKLFPTDPDRARVTMQKLLVAAKAVRLAEKSPERKRSLPLYALPVAQLIELKQELKTIQVDPGFLEIETEDLFRNLENPRHLLGLLDGSHQLRFFNALQSQGGFFLKSSSNRAKIKAEYNFLSQLPTSVRPYFPQVGAYRETSEYAEYEVEKIYQFDLAKLLFGRTFEREETVESLLRSIEEYLEQCPRKTVKPSDYRSSLQSHVVDKLRRRLKELADFEGVTRLDELARAIGYRSVADLGEQIAVDMEAEFDQLKEEHLTFSHGDLCFSNILFDRRIGRIKLIDPRGWNEDPQESYVPELYDIAKLSHSFVGGYDLAVYDDAEIVLGEGLKPELRYHVAPKLMEGLQRGFRAFVARRGLDWKLVRLVEASLFASMLPLHRENLKRTGCQLLQAHRAYADYQASR